MTCEHVFDLAYSYGELLVDAEGHPILFCTRCEATDTMAEVTFTSSDTRTTRLIERLDADPALASQIAAIRQEMAEANTREADERVDRSASRRVSDE